MKKKELIKILEPYWLMAKQAEDRYLEELSKIEDLASKVTGIEGIEMFKMDGELVGIGNYDRTLPLIREKELK